MADPHDTLILSNLDNIHVHDKNRGSDTEKQGGGRPLNFITPLPLPKELACTCVAKLV